MSNFDDLAESLLTGMFIGHTINSIIENEASDREHREFMKKHWAEMEQLSQETEARIKALDKEIAEDKAEMEAYKKRRKAINKHNAVIDRQFNKNMAEIKKLENKKDKESFNRLMELLEENCKLLEKKQL